MTLRSRTNLEPVAGLRSMEYRTRTGALLRIDGIARGAFDGEHERIALPGRDRGRSNARSRAPVAARARHGPPAMEYAGG